MFKRSIHRERKLVWNHHKLVGEKPPPKLKDIWAIRVRLQLSGRLTASAVVATIGNGRDFKSARQFAAWIGLVPSQNTSGGRNSLGHITKRGDKYLRT